MNKALREQVYQKCNGRCGYCGESIEFKAMQVDHIHARDRGGDDAFENLMPSCRQCNFYKSTHTLEGFREQLGKQLERISTNFNYRLLKKYRQIQETPKPIEFYFETAAKHGVEVE